MNATSPIIVIELKKALKENIIHWLKKTDCISDVSLKHKITEWILSQDLVESNYTKIYSIKNTVFAYQNDKIEIELQNEIIQDLLLLKPIELKEIEIYKSVLIDWIFNSDTKRLVSGFELIVYQSLDNTNQFKNQDFIKYVAAVSVKDLGFKLKEFFAPNKEEFKAIYNFFKTISNVNFTLEQVSLSKIYILNQYIMGYSFQMDGKNEEYFFTNIYLNKLFSEIEPISFKENKAFNIDEILDKINKVGLGNISSKEIKFLNNFK